MALTYCTAVERIDFHTWQAGMALTWLNVNADGTHNYNASHEVEACPTAAASDEDRIVLFASTAPEWFKDKHTHGFDRTTREFGVQGNRRVLNACHGTCLPPASPDPPPPTSPPTPPPPTSPPALPVGSASGDLHIIHAGGGRTDLMGLDNTVLSMHQSADAALNARFTYANFTLGPEDPRIDHVLEVHGSFLTSAYVVFKTERGGAPALVRVAFGAERPHKAHMTVTDVATGVVLVDLWVGVEDGALAVGRVKVEVKAAAPLVLVVANDEWEYSIAPGTYRTVGDGARRTRVDISVAALVDPLAARVAPHGLIGQGFDGLHIEGNKDDYVPDAHGVFVTSAQGEGAIEGSVGDYVVDRKDPFSTAFKFGRFDAVAAAPRDISQLNAPIGAPKPMGRGVRATGASDASA